MSTENGLPTLIVDVERRVALQLAFYRRFPMTNTWMCCEAPMCFKCKIEGHHSYGTRQMTCAECAAEEIEIDAQFCPGCGVATVRSEGCSHMIPTACLFRM